MLDLEDDMSGMMGRFYEEFIFWRPRANSVVMPPPDKAMCNVGGSGHYYQLPEIHDAALKTLAKV